MSVFVNLIEPAMRMSGVCAKLGQAVAAGCTSSPGLVLRDAWLADALQLQEPPQPNSRPHTLSRGTVTFGGVHNTLAQCPV